MEDQSFLHKSVSPKTAKLTARLFVFENCQLNLDSLRPERWRWCLRRDEGSRASGAKIIWFVHGRYFRILGDICIVYSGIFTLLSYFIFFNKFTSILVNFQWIFNKNNLLKPCERCIHSFKIIKVLLAWCKSHLQLRFLFTLTQKGRCLFWSLLG